MMTRAEHTYNWHVLRCMRDSVRLIGMRHPVYVALWCQRMTFRKWDDAWVKLSTVVMVLAGDGEKDSGGQG